VYSVNTISFFFEYFYVFAPVEYLYSLVNWFKPLLLGTGSWVLGPEVAVRLCARAAYYLPDSEILF